jgi:hypothetical protein
MPNGTIHISAVRILLDASDITCIGRQTIGLARTYMISFIVQIKKTTYFLVIYFDYVRLHSYPGF